MVSSLGQVISWLELVPHFIYNAQLQGSVESLTLKKIPFPELRIIVPLRKPAGPPRLKLWHPIALNMAENMCSLEKRADYPDLWKLIGKTKYFTTFCKNIYGHIRDKSYLLFRVDLTMKEYYIQNDLRISTKLIFEVVRFSLENNYSPIKLSSLVGIFHELYLYCKSSTWLTHTNILDYFSDCLLLYSVENAPKAIQVFNQFELEEILGWFSKNFLPVVPLLQLSGRMNLKMTWRDPKFTKTRISH